MSTRIFNGYRVRPDVTGAPVTLGDVLFCITSWYEHQVLPIIRDMVWKKSAEKASQYIDAVFSGYIGLPARQSNNRIREHDCPASAADSEIGKSLVDEHSSNRSATPTLDEIDVAFQVGVTQLRNGEILLLIFEPSECSREIKSSMESLPWLEYFGYWNSVDPDPNLTEEEWGYRRECWKEALPSPLGVPADNMFFFTPCVARHCSIFLRINAEEEESLKAKMAEHVPTVTERAHRIARNLAFKERAQATEPTEPHEYMRALQWTHSDEGELCVQSWQKVVEPMLPVIDEDLLATSFEELRERDSFGMLEFLYEEVAEQRET